MLKLAVRMTSDPRPTPTERKGRMASDKISEDNSGSLFEGDGMKVVKALQEE